MNSFRAQQTGSAYKQSVDLSFSLCLRFKHFYEQFTTCKNKIKTKHRRKNKTNKEKTDS